jgi:microcystin-dependent protein
VDQFLGEIRLMTCDVAPRGWALCDGQELPITANQPLYELLGTRFGGDGNTTFALPDLRGRTPIHVGPGYALGEAAGEVAHTLSLAELPTHLHAAGASQGNANIPTPGDALFGTSNNMYAAPTDLTSVHPQTITSVGAGEPHANMQPFLVLSYCIALQGTVPSPN